MDNMLKVLGLVCLWIATAVLYLAVFCLALWNHQLPTERQFWMMVCMGLVSFFSTKVVR